VILLEDIKRMLPHRYPFLLIDRVVELEAGKRCKAIKNVTGNVPFFQVHFPDRAIMPGVLIVEAMAQACGVTAFSLEDNPQDKWLLFAGIDKARFKKPVVPGDQLVLETEFLSRRMSMWVFQGKGYVDDRLVAQAEVRVATVDKGEEAGPVA